VLSIELDLTSLFLYFSKTYLLASWV
jgi:hypothetical protein